MIKRLNATKNGCEHKCNTCELNTSFKGEKMCFYEFQKRWERWNNARKQ